jgi:hypothetical protein
MTKSFRLLKEILSRLTDNEVNSLEKIMASKRDPKNGIHNKGNQLIKVILKDLTISEAEVHKLIYTIPNNIAFRKLIERVIEKLDIIYFNFDKDAFHLYDERNFYFFYVKRKLLSLQMRRLRGVDFDFNNQLEKVIKISKRFELYDVLIEALLVKQRFVGFRLGTKAFDKIEGEIIFYENSRKEMQLSRSLFTMVGSKISLGHAYNEYKGELNKAIAKLKRGYRETNSTIVSYYLMYLMVSNYHGKKKYKAANGILQEMLKTVVNNRSKITKSQHADVLMNLACNSLFLGKFRRALQYSQDATHLYQENTTAYYLGKEAEFYCTYYAGDLINAGRIIQEAYSFSKNSDTPYIHNQRAYLYACIKTLNRDYGTSNALLDEAREIGKDKGTWNIGMRVLRIINCIEAGDFEHADLKVLSLEKFIKRVNKYQNVTKRDMVILRILLKLINEGFNFEKVYKHRKRYFDLLEGNDPDYSWKVKSPELIVFHEWFKKKIFDTKGLIEQKVVAIN